MSQSFATGYTRAKPEARCRNYVIFSSKSWFCLFSSKITKLHRRKKFGQITVFHHLNNTESRNRHRECDRVKSVTVRVLGDQLYSIKLYGLKTPTKPRSSSAAGRIPHQCIVVPTRCTDWRFIDLVKALLSCQSISRKRRLNFLCGGLRDYWVCFESRTFRLPDFQAWFHHAVKWY